MTASDTMTSNIFPRQMRSSAAPVSPLSSAVYCHYTKETAPEMTVDQILSLIHI